MRIVIEGPEFLSDDDTTVIIHVWKDKGDSFDCDDCVIVFFFV